MRKQTADFIAGTGIDQRIDLRRRDQAARGIVNQHPVVQLRAGQLQRRKPVQHRFGARDAAIATDLEQRRLGIEKAVVGRHHNQRAGEPGDL